jgi:hypothetical protein
MLHFTDADNMNESNRQGTSRRKREPRIHDIDPAPMSWPMYSNQLLNPSFVIEGCLQIIPFFHEVQRKCNHSGRPGCKRGAEKNQMIAHGIASQEFQVTEDQSEERTR